jgi:hypothetical protein
MELGKGLLLNFRMRPDQLSWSGLRVKNGLRVVILLVMNILYLENLEFLMV